jgi:hypothetical protein
MESDFEVQKTCCCVCNFPGKRPSLYKVRRSLNENAEVLEENQANGIDTSEAGKIQNPGCFPGDNNKIIDFVIYFKETDDGKVKNNRRHFFRQLEKEDIETFFIKVEGRTPGTKNIFALLNCSSDRLMAEAERLELEVPLDEQVTILKAING